MHFCFFFNDTATTEIYTLSLHDALPISNLFGASLRRASLRSSKLFGVNLRQAWMERADLREAWMVRAVLDDAEMTGADLRSEEHTSELQSRQYLVCRLLLEKKQKHTYVH